MPEQLFHFAINIGTSRDLAVGQRIYAKRPNNNTDELLEDLEARQSGDTAVMIVLRGKKQVRQRLTVKLASPD